MVEIDSIYIYFSVFEQIEMEEILLTILCTTAAKQFLLSNLKKSDFSSLYAKNQQPAVEKILKLKFGEKFP